MADDSTDFAALEAEHRGMTDRDLMLKTLLRTNEAVRLIQTQNSAIVTIKGDYYGDEDRKIRGTKPMVESHEIAIDRGRTIIKTIAYALGVIGIGNIIAVLTVVAR